MLKLYLRDGSRISRYHEAWPYGPHIVEHRGELGSRGERRRHPKRPNEGDDIAIRRILQPAIDRGFAPIPIRDHVLLLVEYAIDRFGTEADLDKRYALQDRLNETLGWTGLGKVDGGSIGSGTMEVACLVVDPEIATRVISDDLASTTFADYTRIFARSETDDG